MYQHMNNLPKRARLTRPSRARRCGERRRCVGPAVLTGTRGATNLDLSCTGAVGRRCTGMKLWIENRVCLVIKQQRDTPSPKQLRPVLAEKVRRTCCTVPTSGHDSWGLSQRPGPNKLEPAPRARHLTWHRGTTPGPLRRIPSLPVFLPHKTTLGVFPSRQFKLCGQVKHRGQLQILLYYVYTC